MCGFLFALWTAGCGPVEVEQSSPFDQNRSDSQAPPVSSIPTPVSRRFNPGVRVPVSQSTAGRSGPAAGPPAAGSTAPATSGGPEMEVVGEEVLVDPDSPRGRSRRRAEKTRLEEEEARKKAAAEGNAPGTESSGVPEKSQP